MYIVVVISASLINVSTALHLAWPPHSLLFSSCSASAPASASASNSASAMAPQPKSVDTPTKSFFMTQIILRILAAAFTLAAISVLVTAKQSVIVFGIVFEARYNYSAVFRFVLGADAVVCGFSLLSLVFVCLLRRRSKSHNLNTHFLLYLHDLLMMLLVVSGCAAGTAVGFEGKYGEEKMGWLQFCDKVTKFCNQVTISLVLSYLAFFCYLAMAVMYPRKFMYQVTE